jgi:hypothetical protein
MYDEELVANLLKSDFKNLEMKSKLEAVRNA